MAIVKHIKSRNANYSAAINYLLFEDDEKTGKKIVDESGRSILRKEFYMDGLSCDPMSFDKECELTNAHFHKNKKREDIKSHHYIISYDPADVTENGLTGERAQAISLELAKQMFPGYSIVRTTPYKFLVFDFSHLCFLLCVILSKSLFTIIFAKKNSTSI